MLVFDRINLELETTRAFEQMFVEHSTQLDTKAKHSINREKIVARVSVCSLAKSLMLQILGLGNLIFAVSQFD